MSNKMNYSLIDYHSAQENNRCGYCSSPNTSFTHGLSTQSMLVQHYQKLIDRGWRRCGTYCYKPMMKKTCCPHYTIKCEALNFQMSKSQKKIMKRMIKFLKDELPKEEEKTSPNVDEDIDRNMEVAEVASKVCRTESDASKMQVTSVSEELQGRLGFNASETESKCSSSKRLKESDESMDTCKESSTSDPKPSKGPQRKAKILRIERKKNKLLAQGKTLEEVEAIMKKKKMERQNSGKTLEDFFDEINSCSNKLELRLVRTKPVSDKYRHSAKESYELYKKYQTSVHVDKKITEDRFTKFLVDSPLWTRLIRVLSDEFNKTLSESVKVYAKYQMTIHKDSPEECDEKSFFDFLVDNPWKESKTDNDGPPQGYGSFHEQYWLNGTLIAVAVLDVLPSCISSVYFFYDPNYSFLSLGTFSSLREVYLTRQLHKSAPNLKFYYMGYYIHSCAKMRYKSKVRPSKLLCPEVYTWHDIQSCLIKLDGSKYCRFNENPEARDENGADIDINRVLVVYQNRAMRYEIFRSVTSNMGPSLRRLIEAQINEYSSLVGKELAYNMFYYLDI